MSTSRHGFDSRMPRLFRPEHAADARWKSSGLQNREMRVRVPPAVRGGEMVAVVQLARAPGCEPGGCGFEARRSPVYEWAVGSGQWSDLRFEILRLRFQIFFQAVAQLVERSVWNREGGGSGPPSLSCETQNAKLKTQNLVRSRYLDKLPRRVPVPFQYSFWPRFCVLRLEF